jgi:hypothetical protein
LQRKHYETVYDHHAAKKAAASLSRHSLSLSAGEDKDAEHTDEYVLDVRVIIHDYSDYSYPGKKRGGLAYDVASIEKQLPWRVKTPIVDLRSKHSQYFGGGGGGNML